MSLKVNWYLSENVRLEAAYGYGHLDRFNLQVARRGKARRGGCRKTVASLPAAGWGEPSPLSGSGLGLVFRGYVCGMRNAKSDVRFGTPRLIKAEESAENLL
jgi:hypothetical protein